MTCIPVRAEPRSPISSRGKPKLPAGSALTFHRDSASIPLAASYSELKVGVFGHVSAGKPGMSCGAQTRHASDAMLARYIREGELFTENVAGALL
jgi:hypothetical protein